MNFDLGGVDTKTLSEKGVDMVVCLLDGVTPLLAKNGKPVTLKLLGPDSKKFRALTRTQVRKRLDRKEALSSEAMMEEADADTLEVLCSCTVGWENMFETDGKPVAFSHENVKAVYSAYPVIRDQVDIFVSQRANFLPASSKS